MQNNSVAVTKPEMNGPGSCFCKTRSNQFANANESIFNAQHFSNNYAKDHPKKREHHVVCFQQIAQTKTDGDHANHLHDDRSNSVWDLVSHCNSNGAANQHCGSIDQCSEANHTTTLYDSYLGALRRSVLWCG